MQDKIIKTRLAGNEEMIEMKLLPLNRKIFTILRVQLKFSHRPPRYKCGNDYSSSRKGTFEAGPWVRF